jgi:hypothetical protein
MQVEETETQKGFDSLFSAGRFLGVLGLLIFITYPGPVLGTRTFCYHDTGLFSYPVAYYLRDSLRHGQWPLWNPYSHCGTPFLAQWNTLALYPLSLFYVIWPMPWSLNIFLLGHLLLGGLGMYRLAHHWFGTRFAASVAGLVFAWNGLSIQCLMWPCQTAGLAWMPWVVWLGTRAVTEGRRHIYWAALAGACQILTGAPETILFTWLIIGAVYLFDFLKSRHGFWVGGGRLLWLVVLVSALSAVQMLPTLDLLTHGDRSSATGNGFWSLPAWGLANFFVPLFHSSPSLSGVFTQDEQQWTSSYYVGILPLALAAIAIWRARNGRTVLLAGIAFFGVILALGDAGFLLNFLKRVAPFLGFIRFPVKFVILTIFCLSLLAGAGVAWLQTQPGDTVRNNVRGPAIWIGLIILALLAVAYRFPFPSDLWRAVWPNALERLAFLLAGLALITLVLKTESPKARAFLSFAFLICLGLDIITHTPPQNPTVPLQAYTGYPPNMTRVPRLCESRAMLSPEAEATMDNLVHPDLLQLYLGQRAELFGDCNLLNRIPKVGGFMPLHLAEERKVAGLLQTKKAAPGLAQFLGVSQMASPRKLFEWEPQKNFMPWATLGQQPLFLDDDATLSALCDGGFLPRQIVYLPSSVRDKITAGADGKARLLSSHVEASECVFKTSAESRTMLVVAQAWYHDWQATLDGSPVPLYRANYAFQALEVPPGQHEVRIKYVDRAFQAGIFITSLALLTCGFFILRYLGRSLTSAIQ